MEKYLFYKDGSLERPRNISKNDFDAASYGDRFDIFEPKDIPIKKYCFSGSYAYDSYKKIKSLKNTINYYFSTDNRYNYGAVESNPASVYMLSSYHLGAGIRKGSLSLAVSDTTASAGDTKEDGILYNQDDVAVGFVLYKEGFVFLTSDQVITGSSCNILTGEGLIQASPSYRWHHFGASSSLNLTCSFLYDTDNSTPTYTTFIYAEKKELNHSNNSTYLKSGSYTISSGSDYFTENLADTDGNSKLEIKNTVFSTINKVEAPIEKQTYITNIGLYDKNKKLVATANLSTPIKKTEGREFLFKLKTDL